MMRQSSGKKIRQSRERRIRRRRSNSGAQRNEFAPHFA